MKFQLDFKWKTEHRCRFKPEHKHTRVPAECKNHVKVHLHAEREDY